MRRSVLIAGVLSVIAGVYFIVVLPVAERRVEIREKLEARYSTLEKYEAFLSGNGKTEAELKAARGRLKGLEDRLIGESDPSLALSRLQARVQDTARSAGLTITSIRSLPTERREAYTAVPVYIDAMGGINAIGEFLRGIDALSMFVAVEKLDVAAAPQESMRIRVQLSGLIKP